MATQQRDKPPFSAFSDLQTTVEMLRSSAHPLTGGARDYDPLLDLIGDARFVLLGEASHGTHEFYRQRAEITKRLICEEEFTAIAVEADWPDAYRINQYVRALGDAQEGIEALEGFKRFPTWMWRNADVLDFVGWLRSHNDGLPTRAIKTGFYGLDLYSLYTSIEAVIQYLEKVDPASAREARARYSCFEYFAHDPQAYGLASSRSRAYSCENEAVQQLVELQRRAGEYARRDGRVAADEFFFAEQNARLAKNAEEYYRALYRGRVSSWNLRDQHMMETLQALVRHLTETNGQQAKVVVWAHNSHLGNARATQMGERGELNLGQLVRETYGDEATLVGFSTYTGTVTAASDWDRPAERKRVRPALRGSYEALFHAVGASRFLLTFQGQDDLAQELREPPRLQRAIGVIYRPETERQSHYFHAWLPDQFDAVLHFDETRAVEPLERSAVWHAGDEAETFPSGL
jgi:erythromycin esterase-like protein